MAGYFGSEVQMRLQRLSDEAHAWSRSTPGACVHGRMLATDDIDRLGFPAIIGALERDGMFGFRLIPKPRAEAAAELLAARGYRLDFWDVFTVAAADIDRHVGPILNAGLPVGIEPIRLTGGPEDMPARALQAFLLANGVVPFSGSMLVGEIGPSATIVLGDGAGAIAAVAYTYLPHNDHSRYSRAAWGGLVAVSADHRGKGLGTTVNAMMAEAAVKLGAERLYELVSSTNEPSRRMVEACGLRHDPAIACGVAVRAGEGRFTR